MRARIVFLLVAALLPIRAALAQSGQALVVRATATPCLAVRTQPSADAAAITCVKPATRVTGIGTAPYWRRIQLADGKKGWAAKKYLDAADSTSAPAGPIDIPEDAWLEVHIVDVGQGDGIWIHTYDDGLPGNGRFEGRNILIDGGPAAADAKNSFLQYLLANSYAGATIDALLVTHPHDDHYPGAAAVFSHFDVCDYYDPGYPKAGVKYATFLATVKAGRCGSGKTNMHMGRSSFGPLNWGAELKAEVLYAYPGTPEGLGSGNTVENNASIVLKLTYGTQSFLFMGDAEGKDRGDPPTTPKYVEAILLNDPEAPNLKSTVLKLAHHGSETSSTLPFIAAVDPRIIIAPSGRKSFSGTYLPDASTLQRYCAHNPAIRIYRTDQDDEAEGRTSATDNDGDHIVLRTNGKVTQVTALTHGKPFTPTACVP